VIHYLAFLLGMGETVLILGFIYYAARVKSAEKSEAEAWTLAKQCMDAKDAAEDGFKKAKEFFDEAAKRPTLSVFTPDQLEDLAKQLGMKLFLYSNTPDVKQ